MYAWMHAQMHACMQSQDLHDEGLVDSFIYIYIYIYREREIYIYIYIYTYIHIYIYTYIHILCTCYIYIYIYIHTCIILLRVLPPRREASLQPGLICIRSHGRSGEAEFGLYVGFLSFVARSSRISPEFHQNFTRISPELTRIHQKSPEFHRNCTGCSPEYHRNFIGTSPEFTKIHRNFTGISPEYRMGAP